MCVRCNSHIRVMGDDTQINTDRGQIGERTGARLVFVRNYLSRDADASTGPHASDLDTGRGCGKKVDVCRGVGGASITQLKGLRTSKSPGVPASAAFAAFAHSGTVPVVALPSGNTEAEEPRYVYRIPRAVVPAQAQIRAQACVGDTDEVDQERAHTSNSERRSSLSSQRRLLLILNLSRSTPSNFKICPLRRFQKYNTARDAVRWVELGRGFRFMSINLRSQLSKWL